MPRRLDISPKDKRDLYRRYARGETPSDLVKSRGDLKLTVEQISNLISREGWAKQRGEIEQTKRRAAKEVLAQVQEDTSTDLERVLRSVHKGLVNDATLLEDGWDLAEDAAGASALQRAKTLHLNRLLRFHGLDQTQQPEATAHRAAALAVVYGRLFEEASRPEGGDCAIPVEAAPTQADEQSPEMTFEFDDNKDDSNE